MPFCANCGTEVQGAFCQKCGTPVAGGMAAGPQTAPTAAAGMPDNLAAALTYFFGALTGIIFLALAPYNQNATIRFHAWQSIFMTLAWIAFWIVLGIVSAAVSIFALLLVPVYLVGGLVGFALWLFLMWKAYQGEMLRLPVVGEFAAKQAGLN